MGCETVASLAGDGLSLGMTQLSLLDGTRVHSPESFARWILSLEHQPRIALADAITQVISALGRRPGKPSTIKKQASVIRQFGRFAKSAGVEHVDDLSPGLFAGFIAAPTRQKNGRYAKASERTMATRQSMMRSFTDHLVEHGIWNGEPLIGKPIPRGTATSARPANQSELDTIKTFAEPGFDIGRRSAIIALRLSGGSARDVANTRCGDINLEQRTVTFENRVNPLDDWAHEQLAAIINDQPSTELVCVTPKNLDAPDWLDNAAQSVTVRTARILAEAGLSDLTPTSVERGAALARFGDDLRAAACFLGSTSLDATARNLNIVWN